MFKKSIIVASMLTMLAAPMFNANALASPNKTTTKPSLTQGPKFTERGFVTTHLLGDISNINGNHTVTELYDMLKAGPRGTFTTLTEVVLPLGVHTLTIDIVGPDQNTVMSTVEHGTFTIKDRNHMVSMLSSWAMDIPSNSELYVIVYDYFNKERQPLGVFKIRTE